MESETGQTDVRMKWDGISSIFDNCIAFACLLTKQEELTWRSRNAIPTL